MPGSRGRGGRRASLPFAAKRTGRRRTLATAGSGIRGRRAVTGVLSRARNILQRTLEWTVLAIVAALTMVVIVGVVFRKLGEALVWYDEVAAILLAWLTWYGAALVALKRGHIGVPTLVERLTGRARMAALLLGEAAVIGFMAVLAWAGIRVQGALGGVGLVSLPAIPSALAQSAIPIGAILFVAAQLLSLPGALRDEAAAAGDRAGSAEP